MAALLLGSLAAETISSARNVPGAILANEVMARKGDGLSYEPAFKESLHAGTEFTLIEDKGDWLEIELHDGRQCWLPKAPTALVKP